MAASTLAHIREYANMSSGRQLLRCSRARGAGPPPAPRRDSHHHSSVRPERPPAAEAAAAEPLPYSQIPGPPSLPVLKQLHSFLPGGRYFNVAAIDQLARFHRDFGRICRLEVPGKHPTVLLYEPSAVQTLFQADGRTPVRGEFAPYIQYRRSRGLGVGIAAAEGDQWRQYRELGQRVLGGPQAAMKYLAQNVRTADMLVAHVRRARDAQNVVRAFQEHAKLWSFESMNVMALGYPVGIFDDNASARRLFDASIDLFECFTLLEQRLPLWRLVRTPLYRRMGRAVDTIWDVCSGYVWRALARPVAGSMIAQVSPHITDDQQRIMVTDVFTDLLFSSVDTTSTTLTYLLHCLAANPEQQEAARREVLSLLPRPDSPLTPHIVNKLSYVKCCLKEALRLHHVAAGVGRVLTRDVVLAGYHVPAGVKCVACSAVMSRDGRYFADPEAFRPERWQRGGAGAGAAQHSAAAQWSYLPFGHGPRMCIGRRFAELETWVAAAQLLRHFRIGTDTPHFRQVMKLINVPDRPIDISFVDLD